MAYRELSLTPEAMPPPRLAFVRRSLKNKYIAFGKPQAYRTEGGKAAKPINAARPCFKFGRKSAGWGIELCTKSRLTVRAGFPSRSGRVACPRSFVFAQRKERPERGHGRGPQRGSPVGVLYHPSQPESYCNSTVS